MGDLIGNGCAVSVFAASGLKSDFLGQPVTYVQQEFVPDGDHGTFDASTGLFTATTAGLYLFLFNSTSWLNEVGTYKLPTIVDLRVDGECKASAHVSCAGRNGTPGYNLSISILLHLPTGSVVGVHKVQGQLCRLGNPDSDDNKDTLTRFTGILMEKWIE